MKIQECRWLERDCQTTMPLRPNPKRTESSNQAIQDAEIRRTPPRAIKDQQLVFGQNGFCDDGSHTAWLKYAHDRSHDILPLITDMSFDEQIIVVGKLRSLEMILAHHLMHRDPWHPRHELLRTGNEILETVREPLNDELLDAKEASRRLGYSVRWLY